MRRFTTVLLCVFVLVAGTGCILNVTSYRDRDGSLVYVGEAYNEGGPLNNPHVVGTFYDGNGNVIATQSGSVCQVLPNKGIAAFEVRLPAGTPDPARVEWKLEGDPIDDVRLATDLTAQVTNTVVSPSGFTFVFGDVRNNGANTYIRAYVCAAWVNERGEVVRVARSQAAGLRFGPGQSLPFELIAEVPPGAVGMRFYLDAGFPLQDDLPQFVTLPPTTFRNSTTDRLSGPGGTVLVAMGEIANTTSDVVAPELAALVRDGAGNLAGVSSFSLCPSAVAPGEVGYGGYIIVSPSTSIGAPTLQVEAVKTPEAVILETRSVSFREEGGPIPGATVSGRFENSGSSTIRGAIVCGALYNAAGDVVGVDYTVLRDISLAPGASMPFSVFVSAIGDPTEARAIGSGAP